MKQVESYHSKVIEGNQWLASARKNLQTAIESRLAAKDGARFEQNNMAFQKFAFDSHVSAYKNAGVLGLDFLDKTKILLTPNAKDLLSPLGKQQAMAMMKLQVQYYIGNPGTAAYHFFKLPYQIPVIKVLLGKKAVKELLEPIYPISQK